MDEQEPTAWEDINPMVSAPRPALPSAPLVSRLEPASREQFRNELTACLALVAPVGMDEQSRVEWLRVAWETLKHLPPDLLSIGCKKARLSCDHPSKIVPAIVAETAQMYANRRELARDTRVPERPRLEPPPPCTPEQARKVLDEFGIPPLDMEPKVEFKHLRKPTRSDYIALGVDPAILDNIQQTQPITE